MEKADDLIAWAIMNSPVPLEAERPRPTPLFDRFSADMRAIADRIVSQLSDNLATCLVDWAWDAYAQAFLAFVRTTLPKGILVERKFEIRLSEPGEWRENFGTFRADVASHLARLEKAREALCK